MKQQLLLLVLALVAGAAADARAESPAPAGPIPAPSPVWMGPQADRHPPTPPLELVVVDVSTTAIVLTWAPSLDDIGVTHYLVRRDGAWIGATASPPYDDCGLEKATVYKYEIVAVDAAGNVSLPSDLVTAKTTACCGAGDRGPSREFTVLATSVASDRTLRVVYTLPKDGAVRLQVFDVAGRSVGRHEMHAAAGVGELRWRLTGLPRGLYFARWTLAGGILTTRFIVNP